MTFAMCERIGISRQRGYWLRCFLSVAFLCAAACSTLQAQLDIDGPLHLAHVQGLVVNGSGRPLAHAEVTLDQDGKVVYRTRTNDAGVFRFDHVLGHYWFRVARTENAPAAREVEVGNLIESYLQRRKLYVIVGPGACADACSSVFTSKGDFEKAIRRNQQH